VPEFWLIDPQRRQAEFFLRGGDGIYRAVPVGADGIFRSEALPGLWLKVDWLWQEPLPPLLDVLAEWGMIRPQT
jgi:Uma2 family endonuclease